MKAYFLPLGSGAAQGLPALLSALHCGAAKQAESIRMLRVTASAPDSTTDSLLDHLRFCHGMMGGREEFAFFRTAWQSDSWTPALPERETLAEDAESRLLLTALRGEGVPFSLRTDREAVEWSLSALLDRIPADFSSSEGNLKPFLSLLQGIRQDLDVGEDVRILLLCDLCEGYAAGLALALIRFLRARFASGAPFIGLVGQIRALGPGAEEDLASVREALSALRDRNLVRAANDRDTLGADACWLLGLPSALMTGEEACHLLDFAAARMLGDAWTSPSRPSAGLHTRALHGALTLQSLDQEAKPAAAFLRGSFWLLSDLIPSLRSYLEHPALIRSLAPATRGGLFRRLFRDNPDTDRLTGALDTLERTLRVLMLEVLSLLRSLPPLLREAEPVSALWDQAVKACGRAITLGAEYDVRRKEAEESGIDKVQPVHRASLSDTEEEELLRKLDALAADLSSAEAGRAEVFHQGGGLLARLALADCLEKCRTAEENARLKLAAMPSDTSEDRYALGLQERRVRLLQAAIDRCGRDLEIALAWDHIHQPGTLRAAVGFSGEILDPALAEQAQALLTSEGEKAETAAKALRDGIGGLLKGYPLNDAKTLLKNLLSTCRQPEPDAPLRPLIVSVYAVCGVEVSGLRLRGLGELPEVPLLPDLDASDRFFSLATAPDRLLAPHPQDRTAQRRGLLALLLLRQYRRLNLGEANLRLVPLRAEGASLCREYLASRGVEAASLALLSSGEGEAAKVLPLGVLLPGRGLEPAKLAAGSPDLIPSWAYWLDREAMALQDPCACLSEPDRQILTEQLTRLRAALNGTGSHELTDFLSDFHQDIMRVPRREESEEDLRRRLRIACGLIRLPTWQKELRRVSSFYEIPASGDAVCAALAGSGGFNPASCRIREDILYAFRGIPLAREQAENLLESAHSPGEDLYLASLDTECDILLHSSDDYHEALAEGIRELLRRYPAANPKAVEIAEALLREAQEPLRERVTELAWPWDTVSASVLTILTECLGPELAPAALHAFSEKLALFPARGGEILGDVLLSQLCTIRRDQPEAPAESGAESPAADPPAEESVPVLPENQTASPIRADAALPPLSPEFARALCRSPQGQSLIQAGFLQMAPEGAGIRVTLTLEGAFTLRLVRVYRGEEIQPFYAHDLPTLALWPSLPFAPGDWHAYFSCAHAAPEFQFLAVTREEEIPLSGSAPRFAAHHSEYPLCYLVYHQETPLGAVPNLLPAPEIPPDGGDWVACLDFGASAASVVFTDGLHRWPMQGPVTVRTLLRSPAATEDLLWREFLPAVPVSALIPAALRLFRRELTEEDLPLRDGAIFMSSSLREVLEVPAEALYTDLKWNGEKGRAVGLYLYQVMLMAALQARCGGARSLRWRFALPEEMAAEGRERLAETLRHLADLIRRDSGLPLPEKHPPVAFASESSALGAYFRLVAPDQCRGGFMALDLGADTADLSLFLQGRDEAVRALQLPLGLHNMLLPSLLRKPEILREDFGFMEEEAFQRDLSELQALLTRARREPAALRQARYALDAILADHLPLFLEALSRRRAAESPGYTGALVLLYEGFLMMLSGLVLLGIAGDSLRNDTLPESMTLFLAGRGSQLMEILSPQTKTSLWKLLTMFRNNRVSSLTLLFSAEKKLEIPVGLSTQDRLTAALPKPASAPAAIAVRPEELMPEFLLRFRREFPQEAALLFPGVYANDYYSPFTPYGQQLLAQALQAAAPRREAGKPIPGLVACLGHLLDMIQEGTPLP